jgi:glucosamine--fructose-6-phosphate aminotransferase (isomerizing)
MCGIFGVILSPKERGTIDDVISLTKSLFLNSEIRGKESTGFSLKSREKKQILVSRRSTCASSFIKHNDFKMLVSEMKASSGEGFSFLGHTRIATNGSLVFDNQPIIKLGSVGVHNGIICNLDELWKRSNGIEREQIIDTELLFGLISKSIIDSKGYGVFAALRNVFDQIEGTASFGLMLEKFQSLLLGSNCGSLYYYKNSQFFAFASEKYILQKSLTDSNLESKESEIKHLSATNFLCLNEISLELIKANFVDNNDIDVKLEVELFEIKDLTNEVSPIPFNNTIDDETLKSQLVYNPEVLRNLKRCTRCILPFTHPYIEFDVKGVCNYCRDYDIRQRKKPKGLEALNSIVNEMKKKDGNNCIVMLSGGRDSCYALHVVKKELGLNPIAYSYDWGMLTDLGRRNQARMCAKLGVEHIIVSADIKSKRKFVRLNVEAFLHKPHLGTIGLFMAGDKAYHYYAYELQKVTGLPLFNGGCPLEWTYFKEGFSEVKPSFMKKTTLDKFGIILFFLKQALKNPMYLNASIWDNLKAFRYYYATSLKVTNLFHYLPWDENVVNETLIKEYNWEVATDTSTTWRIGDGTAAFYNYIYCSVAGFTENDCFRSNQVLEGIISREKALEMALDENKPRLQALRWYCDTIGIDMEKAIKTINKIPKLYK